MDIQNLLEKVEKVVRENTTNPSCLTFHPVQMQGGDNTTFQVNVTVRDAGPGIESDLSKIADDLDGTVRMRSEFQGRTRLEFGIVEFSIDGMPCAIWFNAH